VKPSVDSLTAMLGGGLASPLRILFLLSLLSLLPAIILTMTSFVRTVIVLGFVRQGLGTQSSPPTQVLVGLAMFLTMFTMAPVVEQVQTAALVTDVQAFDAASVPLRRFMLRHTRQADLRLFYESTGTPLPAGPDDVPMRFAIPAFVISELATAFQMGVMILLPFLVVDLAVAAIVMSMGMVMVPPATISLPVKLLLFVLADGWNLVAGAILQSFK